MSLPKVLNKYRDEIPAGAVGIMRPGLWGNPYKIGRDGDRAEVLVKYRVYLRYWLNTDKSYHKRFLTLADAPALVCCCKPTACHGDIMVEVLGELIGKDG